MKKLLTFALLTITLHTYAQKKQEPKLVVGIVVDQMRVDYIYRYWDRFSEGGFKRLVNKGYLYKNAQYDYVPTYTGPGHASIYTGTTPAVHGIIANDWYNKRTDSFLYCAGDSTVNSIGIDSKAGKMSPRNMLSTTIGDELRLANMKRSKVFAISLKDRSSILPAGHNANGAFWFETQTGKFISSSYYMQELPSWLNDFNAKKHADSLLKLGWNTLFPIESYLQSTPDKKAYEHIPAGFQNDVFPYTFPGDNANSKYKVLRYTPHGNTITKDLALACIKAEKLGKNEASDLLAISFSSTDYVGHAFGPKSVEIEDMYLRLDLDLKHLLNELDKEVGKDNYVIFLTADHGACDVPHYLEENNIPSGYIHEADLEKSMKAFLYNKFQDSLITSFINQQVYLDEEIIEKKKLKIKDIEQDLARYVLQYKGVSEAYTSDVLKYGNSNPELFRYRAQKGYNYVRSGNVAIAYLPGWIEYMEKGTTHGSAFNYDTHIPIIFYGKAIPAGSSVRRVSITDIASTICTILQIPYPNGNIGNPLKEVSKGK